MIHPTEEYYHISKPEWVTTPDGDQRGYIQPRELRELWFHTGTICNLSCPFCLEGSRPGDNRLNMVTLEDVRPLIDEALTLGVERFSLPAASRLSSRKWSVFLISRWTTGPVWC